MEIDAIMTKTDKRNPFPAMRSLCIQNNLCFRCLHAFDPKTHMVNGERCCPNKNASLADKLALISNRKIVEKKKEDPIHQIAALSIEEDTDEQDEEALRNLGEEEREVVDWLIEEYVTGLSEVVYPHTSDSLDVIKVNSIKLMADSSYPRRVVVPATLKTVTGSIQTMAFLDIGLMTNFVDDRFAKRHRLKLEKKILPLRCEAYDGTSGQDVEWEWNGRIEAVRADGETESFPICLNVTRLGKHEVMIGLPWMEEIGCVLKLIRGGSYLILGKKLLISAIVLENELTTTLDCEQVHSASSSSFLLPHTVIDPISNFSVNEINIKQDQNPSISETLSPFQKMISQKDFPIPLTHVCKK